MTVTYSVLRQVDFKVVFVVECGEFGSMTLTYWMLFLSALASRWRIVSSHSGLGLRCP